MTNHLTRLCFAGERAHPPTPGASSPSQNHLWLLGWMCDRIVTCGKQEKHAKHGYTLEIQYDPMQYDRDIATSGGEEAQPFSITYLRLRKGFVFVWYGQESKPHAKQNPNWASLKRMLWTAGWCNLSNGNWFGTPKYSFSSSWVLSPSCCLSSRRETLGACKRTFRDMCSAKMEDNSVALASPKKMTSNCSCNCVFMTATLPIADPFWKKRHCRVAALVCCCKGYDPFCHHHKFAQLPFFHKENLQVKIFGRKSE